MKVCMSNPSVVNDEIAALTVNDPTYKQDEVSNSKDEYDRSFSWPRFMAVTKVCSASKDQSHRLYKSMTDVKVNDNIPQQIPQVSTVLFIPSTLIHSTLWSNLGLTFT